MKARPTVDPTRIVSLSISFSFALVGGSHALAFYYDHERELYKDGELIREKRFKEAIPRDHQ